jgi:hypothetical protein
VLGFSTNLIYGRVLPGIALSLDDDLHWPSWVESIGSTHWLFDAQRGNHGLSSTIALIAYFVPSGTSLCPLVEEKY